MDAKMSRLLAKKMNSFKKETEEDYHLLVDFRKYVVEHSKSIKSVNDIPDKFSSIMK